MTILRRLILVAGFVWFIASPAAAQESWAGKTILTKKDGIKLSRTDDKGRQVQDAELYSYSEKVLDDKNGRLLVKNRHGVIGWFDKADAVPLEDAIAFFTARIQKDAKDAGAFIRRGIAFSMKMRDDDALEDLNAALQLEPKNVDAYSIRGRVRTLKKEFEKAIADFNEAVRLDAKNLRALSLRGLMWIERSDFDKAIEDFSSCIRLDPSDANAYGDRSDAWNGKLHFDKAIADLSEALRIDPHGFSIEWHCRLTALSLGRRPGSVRVER